MGVCGRFDLKVVCIRTSRLWSADGAGITGLLAGPYPLSFFMHVCLLF